MRPPFVKMQGSLAFSRVPTEDSDLLIFCDKKDEPALKLLWGNIDFFRVRSSRCPLHLRQQIHGVTHIHIAERILLLTCFWKVGIPLE